MTAKEVFKIALTLVAIYVAGGLILAVVYAKTSPIMYHNAQAEKERAVRKLIPEADHIRALGDWSVHEKRAEYYVAYQGDRVIGYIIRSFGKGYSSYIDTLIAVNPDFTVREIDILGHAETPGLGDEIETEAFRRQFVGKGARSLNVVTTETTEEIQAISGATISSRAVAEDAVRSGVEFLIQAIKAQDETQTSVRKGDDEKGQRVLDGEMQ